MWFPSEALKEITNLNKKGKSKKTARLFWYACVAQWLEHQSCKLGVGSSNLSTGFFKMWQDIVITISIIFFAYALIPQIIQGFKKRKQDILLQTSLITSIGMYAITIAYLTLNLIFSSITAAITGTLWAIIAIQKIFYK